jgi:hypothetical protein
VFEEPVVYPPPETVSIAYVYDGLNRLVDARYYPTGERFEYACDCEIKERTTLRALRSP